MSSNINNFDEKSEQLKDTTKDINFVSNITDDDKLNSAKLRVPDEVDRTSSENQNVPDEDLIENIDEIKQYLRRNQDLEEEGSPTSRITEEDFNRVPSLPPPPRPTSTKHPYLDKLTRLSTFKDMLVFNAENYIKENVPRLPEGMFEHHSKEKEIKTEAATTPSSPVSPTSFSVDETDILLPTRRTVVDGIEADDMVKHFYNFLSNLIRISLPGREVCPIPWLGDVSSNENDIAFSLRCFLP